MRTYLGVDGGGSKTAFVLIDETGRVLATHAEGSAYYLEIGLEALKDLLARGTRLTLQQASVPKADFAFLGLPAYGEDSRRLPELEAAAAAAVPGGRVRCGNDMVCGWAGALACEDGINIVAGTGSIAYGEYAGRTARAGGWGELFGDEGSAYWLAREGLTLFSRMSDGRAVRGPLYELMRRHFALGEDLDLCGAVYGQPVTQRSQLAALSKLIVQAAMSGDDQASALFERAVQELTATIAAVRDRLQIPAKEIVTVSYSGGLFRLRELLLAPLEAALGGSTARYQFVAPRLPPQAGAALYAMKLSGQSIDPALVAVMEKQFPPSELATSND